MPLRIYNTLSRAHEEFIPADPARVTFYTCGPTVYDDAHIGNFRSFLAADLLRRWLESPLCELRGPGGRIHAGPRRVLHVMNITDVGHMTEDASLDGSGEDKMAAAARRLAEAKKSGALPLDVAGTIDPADPYAIARFYEARFLEDARRLNLEVAHEASHDPTLTPRATENIPAMIEVIRRLIARAHAYVVGQPGRQTVYFDVRSFPAYGRLSGNTLARLREGAGGRIGEAGQSQKRHPADFLLWKSDPAHIMKWDSPWGWGYPGWHVECTAMSVARLAGIAGDGEWLAEDARPLIDIHSGGEDNIFPHHECEIAQSCCAFNQDPAAAPFASLWFHPRFLLVEGEKMSKSRGSFYTARDLFARGVEPAALRLELIKTHYRSNANFTMQGLADSQRMVDRWRRHAEEGPADAQEVAGASESFLAQFAAALNSDLNIAEAIASVNIWMGRAGAPERGDAHVLRSFIAPVLGIDLEPPPRERTSIGVFADGLAADPRIVEKLERRREARDRRDFARSDAIRGELLAMGYAIKDMPGGTVEVRRV